MTEPRPKNEADLVELIRSSDVRAPDALHRRIESLVAERSSARRRRPVLGGASPLLARRLAAATALLAVTAAVLVAALGGGGGSSLSLHQATALTLGAATAPAPRESSPGSSQLVAA